MHREKTQKDRPFVRVRVRVTAILLALTGLPEAEEK